MIGGFDHVAILAREIEAATTAYGTLFGRAPSWRTGGDGARRALFTLDNMTVELVAPDGAGASGDLVRNVLAAQGEGLASICFRTDDIAKMHRRLDRLNLKPEPVSDAESRDE
ncbi:MAG TPA: VOC family protein, partial [Bradyrhizobium sp.]